MIPLLGFTPDAAPTTQGVITACSNIAPTERGIAAAPSGVPPAGVGSLASDCRGAATLTKLDGTRRVIAGTAAVLSELSGGTWSDVSRSGGYTGADESRWQFAQFGDDTIATDGVAPLQISGSGAFADIAGAPKAKVVCTSNNFVLAFNTNDGGYGVSPDRWWCSALLDASDWTPDVSTQCTTGRLVSVPGEITAALPFGAGVVAYKSSGMYLGSYVGAPVVWQWDQVPGDQGCVGVDAVCDVRLAGASAAHVFVGADANIYLFTGTQAVSIAAGKVARWFAADSSPAYRYRTICRFDRQANRVWIFYPSRNSETPDSALIYHMETQQWGYAPIDVEAAMAFVSPGYTIDSLSSVAPTVDEINIPFDSQYWLAGGRTLAVWTDCQILALNGVSSGCSITSGDIGDDDQYSTLRSVRARFMRAPTSGTGQVFSKANSGENATAGGAMSLTGSRWDVMQSARWHSVRLDMTGDCELNALRFDLVPDGLE
jgi:hypothetical protein